MYAYDSNEDILDLRNDAFRTLVLIVLVAGAAIGFMMLATYSMIPSGTSFAGVVARFAPILALGGIIYCTRQLMSRNLLRAAKWSLIAGLFIAPTLAIVVFGPSAATLLPFALPILISSVIIGRHMFGLTGVGT